MFKKYFFICFFVFGISSSCIAYQAKQEFDVKIGIFDAAHIALSYDVEGEYKISATVKTKGIFDSFYPFTSIYQGNGKVFRARIIPQVYQAEQKTRNHKREKIIYYNSSGKAYMKVSAKDGKKSVRAIENIPESATMADLQAVFVGLILRYSQNSQCRGEEEVYDGKKHFKVVFNDLGREKRYFSFLGEEKWVDKCSMYVKNIEDNNDNVLWEVSSNRPIYLWLKKDENTKNPFLMEINIDSTPLGALKVIPTSLTKP